MADDKKGNDKASAAAKSDVRAEDAESVRVDANERLSYKEYAALFKKPIVTIQRIIDRKGLPLPKMRTAWPNMQLKTLVKWGEPPKEPPAMPERAAATVKSYIMQIPTPRRPPPPGIGSMEPGKA